MNIVKTRDTRIADALNAKQAMINSLFGDKQKANKFLATAEKVASNDKLAKCSDNSIIDACLFVAQLGLDLSPVLSHAYLVPYKGSIQLIVSARGYTALLARTGWKLKTYVVHDGDEFEYSINGFEETVVFKKNLDLDDDDNRTFKYAIALAQSPDGILYVEVMNAKKINKHRLLSASQTYIGNNTSKEDADRITKKLPVGMWRDWPNEMACKTVAKKLAKKLPIGEGIANVIYADDNTIETVEAMPTVQKNDLNEIIKNSQIKKIEPTKPTAQEVVKTVPTEEVVKTVAKTAQYPALMKEFFDGRGMSEEEKAEFCKWLTINDETVYSFLDDQAETREKLVKRFYEEIWNV